MLNLSQFALRETNTHTMPLSLEPAFTLEVLIPSILERVKLAQFILSHALSPVPICLRKSLKCITVISLSLQHLLTL